MKRTIIAIMSAILLVSCGQSNTKTDESKPGYSEREAVETILARKSVREYTEEAVEQKKIDLLIRAAMAAPSGMDRRPWEIVVVNERAALDSMAAQLPYAKMLNFAPMAIVVCGNSERSSYWYLDCSAASQNILLTAEALGLGAVWTAAYPYDDRINAVSSVLQLPENIIPLNVIPVGYPSNDPEPKNKFDESKVHYNRW